MSSNGGIGPAEDMQVEASIDITPKPTEGLSERQMGINNIAAKDTNGMSYSL